MKSADSADVELDQLIGLFYAAPHEFGRFTKIKPTEMPAISRQLLAHDHHMTVTVERFHDCQVDLQVLQSRTDGDHYSRQIVLTRQTDHRVVMFGIVRLDLSLLTKPVRVQVQKQELPLGRILIEQDVLRVVKLVDLFAIVPGAELTRWLHGTLTKPTNSTGELPASQRRVPQLSGAQDKFDPHVCYGRTALIYCDGRPAIELLEIVSENCNVESLDIRADQQRNFPRLSHPPRRID